MREFNIYSEKNGITRVVHSVMLLSFGHAKGYLREWFYEYLEQFNNDEAIIEQQCLYDDDAFDQYRYDTTRFWIQEVVA